MIVLAYFEFSSQNTPISSFSLKSHSHLQYQVTVVAAAAAAVTIIQVPPAGCVDRSILDSLQFGLASHVRDCPRTPEIW